MGLGPWFDAASASKPGGANRAFEILRAMLKTAPQWGELGEDVPDACANIVMNPRRPVARYLMRETPYQANRTLGVLSRMFSLAELWGWRPDGSNPCLHVKRYTGEKRERFLSAEEFACLGRILDEILAEGSETRSAVVAVRLLMPTGCRLSEIQKLRWEHVDLDAGELRLPDSKTGGRTVPLASSAVRLLKSLPRDEDNSWVIAGRKPGSHLTDLQHSWRRIRARAGLDGVRIHDLRHSFASRALALGEGLPMIGKLLGHTQVQTTARYAHLARDTVKASAARIGDSIDRDLEAVG